MDRDLVSKYLSGEASEEESARLRAEIEADPAALDEVFAAAELERDLVEVLRSAAASRTPQRSAARRPSRRSLWIGVAAAGFLLAALGCFFLFQEEAVPAALVERAEGTVFRVDGSGRGAVATGDGLAAGQGLETNGTGRAVLRFDDGTRVTLSPGTRVLKVRVAEGKRFFVAQGTIAADVARQPGARPMILRTPEGETMVLGTRFTLTAARGSTRLEVEKGQVQLKRLSDMISIIVAEGQFAVAAEGVKLEAKPLSRPAPAGAAMISGMPPNSWLAAPGTEMAKVAPDRAKVPSIQGRVGCDAVVSAWSGGALDTKRNWLVLWGGGYTDYHGNELYAFSVDSMAWERLTEPAPNPALNSEANGDGTPNSRATYNGLAYVAHADRFFALGGAVAGNGFAVCKSPWTFDFEARKWARRAPSGSAPSADLGAACSYDPVGRKIWWGDNSGLHSYDYDADRWTRHNEDKFYYLTGAVDTKRGLWVLVGSGEVLAYDIRSASPARRVWRTTGGDALVRTSNPGLDYDPVRDRIVAWSGAAVYALNPETKAWTAFDAPGAPAPTPNGIFGRWRYVPGVDAFILVAAAGEDVRFYKPDK